MTGKDRIKKLKQGDPDAFEALVNEQKNRVINLCYGFVHGREDAEDISQEVFVEVFRSIARFRETSQLSTWIYRIAVAKSLDFLKAKRRKKRFAALLHIHKSPEETERRFIGARPLQPDESFGEAQGMMEAPPNSGNFILMDVHGAGAQRSDPKTGLSSNYPQYNGPQGDVQYVFNYTRCVRDASGSTSILEKGIPQLKAFPNPVRNMLTLSYATRLSSLVIYNAKGEAIMQLTPGDRQTTVDTSQLSSGIYLVAAVSKKGFGATRRICMLR